MRILLVEDEPLLRDGIRDLLKGAQHEVVAVGDGLAAVERGVGEVFDLVVLDLMLPKLDGISVCRRLKEARPSLPILMLTARGSEDDKVRGLVEGADDYVVKPFGARELIARVQAIGRRTSVHVTGSPDENGAEILEVDGCSIDLGRCLVTRRSDNNNNNNNNNENNASTTTELTVREVGLLRFLHQHRERAVGRAELLERVWRAPATLQTRTIDMTIANLRKKIERDPTSPRIVVSVKGLGYAWGTKRPNDDHVVVDGGGTTPED